MMEDKLYNMMCCTYEPRYSFIDECVYLYRITEDSATNRYKYKAEDKAGPWICVGESFSHFIENRGIQDDYEDLLAFHLLCGFFSIGTRSLQSEEDIRAGFRTTAELLKSYGQHPLVKEIILKLAKGKHVHKIQSFLWRAIVRTASVLICLKAYRVLVWGIVILGGLGTEKRTSRLKHKRIHKKICLNSFRKKFTI